MASSVALVPTDDPGALADAIVEVADDRELRRELAERGPGRAGSYSPASVARRMISFADGISDPVDRPANGVKGAMDDDD